MQAAGPYSAKLRDPRWQRRRLEILSRDEFRCQACFADDRTLHVHHLWYENAEPWDYPDDALVTLCEVCHEFETAESRRQALALLRSIRACGASAEDLRFLVEAFDSGRSVFIPSFGGNTGWVAIAQAIREALEITKRHAEQCEIGGADEAWTALWKRGMVWLNQHRPDN